MFKNGANLFGQEWIDTVFEGRNKDYGAYEMRRKGASTTVKALAIGVTAFSLLVSLPLLANKFSFGDGEQKTIFADPFVIIDLNPPADTPEPIVPPTSPPPENQLSAQDIIRFRPPVVAPDANEEMPPQSAFVNAVSGRETITGDPDGTILIDQQPETTLPTTIIEPPTGPLSPGEIEVPADPGYDFRRYIAESLTGITLSNGLTALNLEFKFVVNRNGSLTDIVVVRDGGYPDIAAQAVKAIENARKWNPAVMNGRTVRMSYRLPITIQVDN
ncbi:MAG: energy transducer TonB [Rikenellaceae bacterium]|jgi:protein TonB|nr:energy transducer TonB [Rikenellaceae bacterium]